MPIHQTNTHIVTALFESMKDARSLVEELRGFGIPDQDLSIISSGKHYGEDQYKDLDQSLVHDYKHYAEEGMETGAYIGGTGGFLVGLGSVVVPGVGPLLVVGGLLAATITGVAAGGVAGGLVGSLMDLKVPKERAEFYDEGVKRGRVLVVVKASAQNVSQVADLIALRQPIELEQRMDLWRRDQMREPTPQGS